MEDRHSISEPRPIRETSRAEWEVDILRDDTLVVDTFVINDEVLPPRTGKKGKVLWRLPDTVDKLVSAYYACLSRAHINMYLQKSVSAMLTITHKHNLAGICKGRSSSYPRHF